MKYTQTIIQMMASCAFTALSFSAFADQDLYTFSCRQNAAESYSVRVSDNDSKGAFYAEVSYFLHDRLAEVATGQTQQFESALARAKYLAKNKLVVKTSDQSKAFVFGYNSKSSRQSLEVIDLVSEQVSTLSCQ